jgi:hypothetical protein
MTHRNNFVAVVKCRGAILREHDGTVSLPFGSEYSILLKNLDDRKASVGISIDGQSVTEGRELVVCPNTSAELLGFMQGATVRNKFKFIQKTREIVEHRGDRIDDGIIRVEFTFEKRVVEDIIRYTHYEPWYPWYSWYPTHPTYPTYPTITYRGATYDSSVAVDGSIPTPAIKASEGTMLFNHTVNCCSFAVPEIAPNEGITVHGGVTFQSFIPVQLGELEDTSTVITIRLVGVAATGAVVETPTTTKDKLRCPTCGKVSGSDTTYCSRCGTNIATNKFTEHVEYNPPSMIRPIKKGK